MSTDIESLVRLDIDLTEFYKEMVKAEKFVVKSLGKGFETVWKSMGPKLSESFTSTYDSLKKLSDVLGTFDGIASFIQSLVPEFASTTAAATGTTVATQGTSAAMKGLKAASGYIGIIITALIALVTFIASVLSNAETETSKLRKEIKETSNAIDEIKEKTAEQADETEVSAAAAQKLAKELYTLQSKEGKSNDEKKRMVALTEELNKLCPGLNLNLNKQTYALDKQYDAVKNVIEGMKQKALTQIYEEEYIELLKKQITLEDQYGKATDIVSAKRLDLAHAEEKAAVEGDFLGISVGNAQSAVNDATAAQKEAYDAWVENDKAVSDLEQTIGGLAMSYGTTGDAIDTFTQDQIKNMESMGYSYDDLKTKDSDTLDQILSDWQDNQDKMQEILDERVEMTQNAFGEIDSAANTSYDDLINNLNSNAEKVNTWTANINSLETEFKGENLDTAFIDHLKELGPEYYQVVQNLINEMNSTDFAGFNELAASYKSSGDAGAKSVNSTYSSGSGNKSDYTYSGSGTGTAESTNIADTVQDQFTSTDFISTGTAVMTDFITGMESMREPLNSEVDSLMGDIVNKMTTGTSSSESDSEDGASTESAGAAAATNIATEVQNQILSVDFTSTGATVMTNFMAGMESMREPLLDKVTSLLKSVAKRLSSVKFVVKVSPTALQLDDRYNAKGGIRKHAQGGITNGTMIMDIMGEAGAEALLPLESNTGWMDRIADKVAAKMGSLNINLTSKNYTQIDGRVAAASTAKQNQIISLMKGRATI